jgi:hypothetical protein
MTDYKGAGQPGDKAHKHRLDRFYLDAQATGWPTPKNITGGPEARESRKRRPRSGGEQSGSRNLPGSKANMGVSLTDAVKTGTSTTPRQKPPGPNEREFWAAIIERYPGLAPAVDTEIESDFRGVADGISAGLGKPRATRVDELRALGNAVLPAVAAYAWIVLNQRIGQ